MIAIADTSGLLAAIDADDPEHENCRSAIAGVSWLIISPLVLAELDYLLAEHLGEKIAMATSDRIATSAQKDLYKIADILPEMLTEATAVRARYISLALGLTDAINVVLAAHYSTAAILTLDRRHFRAIRPIAGSQQAFRLLPDDRDG